MRDSLTYQAMVEEGVERGRAEGLTQGRVQGAREALIRLGTRQFGPPDERIVATLTAIGDLDRLYALEVQVLDVSSWDEILSN